MGSSDAWFANLYQQNSSKMVMFASRVLGRRDLAEDVVQNVFVILLAKQEDVKRSQNPVGWLYKTLRFQIGNELQRAENKNTVSLFENEALSVEDSYHFILDGYLPSGLSDEDERILRLFFERQMTTAEIAREIGCSPGACRVRLFRAKNHCRELLINSEKQKVL